jgi:hypothetical protein
MFSVVFLCHPRKVNKWLYLKEVTTASSVLNSVKSTKLLHAIQRLNFAINLEFVCTKISRAPKARAPQFAHFWRANASPSAACVGEVVRAGI